MIVHASRSIPHRLTHCFHCTSSAQQSHFHGGQTNCSRAFHQTQVLRWRQHVGNRGMENFTPRPCMLGGKHQASPEHESHSEQAPVWNGAATQPLRVPLHCASHQQGIQHSSRSRQKPTSWLGITGAAQVLSPWQRSSYQGWPHRHGHPGAGITHCTPGPGHGRPIVRQAAAEVQGSTQRSHAFSHSVIRRGLG